MATQVIAMIKRRLVSADADGEKPPAWADEVERAFKRAGRPTSGPDSSSSGDGLYHVCYEFQNVTWGTGTFKWLTPLVNKHELMISVDPVSSSKINITVSGDV